MISERARVVTVAYLVSDLIMTAATLFVAHTARRVLGGIADEWIGPVYPFSRYMPLLLAILPVWAIVFSAVGLYGRKSARTLRTEVSRLSRAISICGLLLAFSSSRPSSRSSVDRSFSCSCSSTGCSSRPDVASFAPS